MVNIEGLRKIIKELSENKDLPADGKEALITLAHNIIRSEEIVNRFSDYFKNGYHFGYFLIQSQRIENTVKMVIEAAERLKASTEERDIQEVNLNIPLGPLIGVMEKYIESEDVLKSLNEFNKFRKKIIHRLYEDFSQDLDSIETSVAEAFPPEKINTLQTSLLEIGAQINLKIAERMDDSMVAKRVANQLGNQLQNEIGISGIEFKLL
ncbi:MAG TPA: hypothetical protein VLB83_00180 [Candidatus Paceibacterota bacterium]|nr:hypothetical protein [Candidatus Paceibacterota bacterium]